jgi:hypothetical protein
VQFDRWLLKFWRNFCLLLFLLLPSFFQPQKLFLQMLDLPHSTAEARLLSSSSSSSDLAGAWEFSKMAETDCP